MRYKLTIAYDGRAFAGWQSQIRGHTIQDAIESAIASLVGEQLRLHAAGRTDAGVHALGQVAHFDAPESCRLDELEWHRALNALLPATIRVMRFERTTDRFHARFDARGKVYRYRIWHDEILPPLEAGLAWHLHGTLDRALLRKAASLFEGTHDFAVYSANRSEETEGGTSTTRTIFKVEVKEESSLVTLDFTGDGFLYKMVRMITGAAVHVARHRAPLERLTDLLANPSQKKPGWQAPPDGLYLVRVDY